jgi:hypothetical protein
MKNFLLYDLRPSSVEVNLNDVCNINF